MDTCNATANKLFHTQLDFILNPYTYFADVVIP